MGFSNFAAEKALFMTLSKGQSVENAMDWINEHMEDSDFNEQLFMVGQEGEGSLKKEYAGNLSKEERIAIAEEKIKAGRLRRAEEAKLQDHQREMNRMKDGKESVAAKRIFEEQEMIQAIAQRKKDKEELAKAKIQAQLRIERDKCERFGIPFDEKKILG